MRIGCLQFAPQVGDVDNNLNRADAVLNKANPRDLDLLVLPELAFSGYNFQSLDHISSFLEPTASGITSLWARTTALKYDCVVTVGYPEKIDGTTPEYYNSAITVSADGETLINYRKSFLYYTDETWAHEGNGFYSGMIKGLGNVAMGICMDLNPYRFESPWTAWEFAHHALHVRANVVVLSMAWLTREDIRTFSQKPRDPDMETLSYWLARLEPMIRAESQGEIIVVFANRCGTEDGDVLYAGTSAVLGINAGEVKVYGILGRGEKELLVVDTDGRVQAKLVSQPNLATSAKPADDIMSDALVGEPNYESERDSENSYEPDGDYECVSPISATDSRLPQAYFGRTNLNLGPSLQSSLGLTYPFSPSSPMFQRPPSPKLRNARQETQAESETSKGILGPDVGIFELSKGRPNSVPEASDAFESSFTRNSLGPRSQHILPRPISTMW